MDERDKCGTGAEIDNWEEKRLLFEFLSSSIDEDEDEDKFCWVIWDEVFAGRTPTYCPPSWKSCNTKVWERGR